MRRPTTGTRRTRSPNEVPGEVLVKFGDEKIDVLIGGYMSKDAAEQDYEAVLSCGGYLHGAVVVTKDLEGNLPRRIHYYPKTGRVVRRLLAGGESNSIAREESDYASRLSSRKTSGDIQLFGED